MECLLKINFDAAARGFDLGAGAFGDALDADFQRHGNFAASQNDHRVGRFRQDIGLRQHFRSNFRAALEASELIEVDFIILTRFGGVKPSPRMKGRRRKNGRLPPWRYR